jgi:hypothetical protein
MFKTIADVRDSKKYQKALRASLRRLKKLQLSRNAKDTPGGGAQTNDVMQFIRYFGDYTFDDADKPGAMLLVGKKTLVTKIGDEAAKGDGAKKGKDAPKPPQKKAKGVCFWNDPNKAFHFLVKGPVKVADLVRLLKKAGIQDPVVLGEGSDQDEARASASETQNEELDAALGEEVEGQEETEEGAEAGEPAPQEEPAPTDSPLRQWRDAKEKVDARINQLCDRLRKTGDNALIESADKLVAALTKYKVGLETSLLQYEQAAPEARAGLRPKALQFIDTTRQHVKGNPLLIAADDNFWKIPVNGVDTLTAALDRVRQTISG